VFRAKTEAELARLQAMEAPISQGMEADRTVMTADKLKRLQWMREDASRNEASALAAAAQKATEISDSKWQAIISEKERMIAEAVSKKEKEIAEKVKILAEKDKIIAELVNELGQDKQ
jgi:hypothetical protein